MPTILRVGVNRFFFFSRKAQKPPHVHVARAERHAKFWLEPVTLAQSEGFRSHDWPKIFYLGSFLRFGPIKLLITDTLLVRLSNAGEK